MAYKDKDKQRAFQRLWKSKQRVKYRTQVLTLLGGKCSDCEIDDVRVLEVDHIEPLCRTLEQRTKDPQTGSSLVQGIITGRIKIDQVILRCANCHRIKTANDQAQRKYNVYKGL